MYTVDELITICKQCIINVCNDNKSSSATLSEIARQFPFMRTDWSRQGTIVVRIDKEFIHMLVNHLEKTGGVQQKKTSKLIR